MTVKKVQFESMDEVNRFLDVTEHFPFAVDLKRGSRTVNGKSILGVASIGLGREMDFCSSDKGNWLRTKRDGFLYTCAGACAGDHIHSWFLHEVGLRVQKINNG